MPSTGACKCSMSVSLWLRHSQNPCEWDNASNVTSHSLEVFDKSCASVKQTYFSTLMAYRSRNRVTTQSCIIVYNYTDKSCPPREFICFKVSFLVLTYTTHEMKLKAIILKGKVISSILKDFLAWHVM